MKFVFLLLAISLCSCTHNKGSNSAKKDIFDNILLVQNLGTVSSLLDTFGPPLDKKPEKENALIEYKYEKFSVSVDEKNGKVIGTSMPYWVNYDAYAFLKKRFEGYKWIEVEVPSSSKLDYSEEIHRVEIPQLGITFEYDNQDPLRRPMWIFFK